MHAKRQVALSIALLVLIAFPISASAQSETGTPVALTPDTEVIVIEFDGDGTITRFASPRASLDLYASLTKVSSTTLNIYTRILNPEGGFCYYSIYLERRAGTSGSFSSYKSWQARTFTGMSKTDSWDESVDSGYQYRLSLSASTGTVGGSTYSDPVKP